MILATNSHFLNIMSTTTSLTGDKGLLSVKSDLLDRVTFSVKYTSIALDGFDLSFEADRKRVLQVRNRDDFVNLLQENIRLQGHPDNIQFHRKSKKSKKLVPLATENDFKEMARSLKVKSTVNLFISFQSDISIVELRQSLNDIIGLADNVVDKVMVRVDNLLQGFIHAIQAPSRESRKSVSAPLQNTHFDNHADVVHPFVACDVCSPLYFVPLRGIRYKCTICPDFDICASCELAFARDTVMNGHSGRHPLIKIVDPEDVVEFPGQKQVQSSMDDHIIRGERYLQLIRAMSVDGDENTTFEMIQSLIEESKRKDDKPIVKTPQNSTSFSQESADLRTSDHKVQVKTKEVYDAIQVTLHNTSPFLIAGGDLTFEFLAEDGDLEGVVVRKASSIAPGQMRFYNLGNLTSKMLQMKPTTLRISTYDHSLVMEGRFESRGVSNLNIMTNFIPEFETESIRTTSTFSSQDEISVVLVPKSDEMSQIIVTNKSSKAIDCSDLKFEIFNCFDTSISSVLVHKKHGILPGKSAKFNMAINSAHLKFPFKLSMRSDGLSAQCSLNSKKLLGTFEFEQAELEVEAEHTISQPSVSSSQNLATESIPIVLPKLAKESNENFHGSSHDRASDTNQAEAEEDEKREFEDYDIISVEDSDGDVTSDFEVLSPINSHE